MLSVKLQMDEKRIEVEHTQRMETNPGDRARPIVVKYKDKRAIGERGHKLKGTIIFLNEGLTEAIRQR